MRSEPNNSMISESLINNHSLSSYLDSLSRGRQSTPRSWLFEGEDANDVLHRWIPIMESANKKSPYWKEFNQFDLEQVKKFGPQGAVPPVESKACQAVLEPLYEKSTYDNPLALRKWFPMAWNFAQWAFGDRLMTKRPKSFKSVVDDMRVRDTLVTNSGFPRFARRSTVFEQEVRDAESELAYDYPAILLFRQYNGKLRPVWMFPMSVNLIEFSFAQIIQEALQSSSNGYVSGYLTPWKGYDDVKRELTDTWAENQVIAGGDTTAMDAHMRPAQIELVYEIVKCLFQKQYWDELHQSLTNINKIDLLYSRTEHYVGTHGLASGSGWTQLTETILQLFMFYVTSSTPQLFGQGIGDDFIWIRDISADGLVDLLDEFGLPANPSKQTVSKEYVHFLQRMNRHGFFSREDGQVLGAYYPTIRALNSMLQPEKFHKPKDWNSDMFCIRNYTILENCVDNPCFDEFLNFVVRGHRDMIPFAKQNSAVIDELQRKSRLVPGLNPSYNQEKREKPLSSYVAIQLAAKM